MAGEIIPEIARQMNQAAETVGRQASSLGQQVEHLGATQQQLVAALAGASDPQARKLLDHLGSATQLTGEVAATLADLQAKIERFAGNVATGPATSGPPSPPTAESNESTSSSGKWFEVRSTSPKIELSDQPWAVEIRKKLNRKMFFFAKRATPADAEDQPMVETALKIDENIDGQMQPDSQLRGKLETFIRQADAFDHFTLQDEAIGIVDTLLAGVTDELDMADVVMVHGGFVRLCWEAEKTSDAISDDTHREITQLLNDLRRAVDQELISRVADLNLAGDHELDFRRIYDRVRNDPADPDFDARKYHELQQLQIQVNSCMMLNLLIDKSELSSSSPENDYNRPLSNKEKANMNEAAAATIEGVHLLKTYGITPLVVEGKRVGLPWDIAIVPPTPPHENWPTPDGALVDFILLQPKPGRERALMQGQKDPTDPNLTLMSVDGGSSMGFFRLHDNGQMVYASLAHNVPSDYSERQFDKFDADAAFTRLRNLFIAMAYDAVVPEDVIRERTGGSVASQYQQNRQRSPREPLTPLLLNRQRELERAQVSPKNRQPTDWEWPTQIIGGYMRKLPEGYKARPTAEDEARAYYESKKLPFDGLPEGMTFVPEYKRGTGPERTTFRQAHFRRGSRTRQFLRGQ